MPRPPVQQLQPHSVTPSYPKPVIYQTTQPVVSYPVNEKQPSKILNLPAKIPSDSEPSGKNATAVVATIVVAIIATFFMVALYSTPNAKLPTELQSPTRGALSWQQIQSEQNILKMEVPSEWKLVENDTDHIHITGIANGLKIRWFLSLRQHSMLHLYQRVEADEKAWRNLQRDMDNYISYQLEKAGKALVTYDGPSLKTLGDMKIIVFDSTIRSLTGSEPPIRSIRLLFDCIPEYTCEADYYHTGTDSISKDEWRLLEHLIQSIQLSPEY